MPAPSTIPAAPVASRARPDKGCVVIKSVTPGTDRAGVAGRLTAVLRPG